MGVGRSDGTGDGSGSGEVMVDGNGGVDDGGDSSEGAVENAKVMPPLIVMDAGLMVEFDWTRNSFEIN